MGITKLVALAWPALLVAALALVTTPVASALRLDWATVSVLGAALALALVGAHALGVLEGPAYALIAGGGLHEVAHVVAASAAAPEVAGLALLTKLARVAMLPVGLAILPLVTAAGASGSGGRAAVPGLAVAFFAVSVAGTAVSAASGESPPWTGARGLVLDAANVALAASMAAIGLRIAPAALRSLGRRTVALAVLGAAGVIGLVSLVVRAT